MKRLDERFLFQPTKTTEINESNAKDLLPETIYEYVTLSNGKTLLKIEGIVGDYVNPNGNNRVYEEAVWDHVLESESHIVKDILENNAWGVREHPDSGETMLPEISHRILSLRKDENQKKIIAEILIVDTAAGRDVRAMLESGGTVGMSTRGMGDTYIKEGRDYVSVGYICETIDFVTVNSVQDARFNLEVNAQENLKPHKVAEAKKSSADRKPELQDETVNSNISESASQKPKSITEKRMVNLQSKRIELASLRVIAESKIDDSQIAAVTEAVALSMGEIRKSVKSGDLSESEVKEITDSYANILETAKQNSPIARELREAKEQLKTLSKKYEALEQISSGLHTRYRSLKENYNELSADSKKPARSRRTPPRKGSVSEAGVKASKRYKALLSLAEGLVVRAKRAHKISESAKAKAVKSLKETALSEAKLEALSSHSFSDKASALLMKCESVKQVARVVARVSKLNESEQGSSKGLSKPELGRKRMGQKKVMVESQAHKEPLPTSPSKAALAKKEEPLHESLSVVQRMRRMKK